MKTTHSKTLIASTLVLASACLLSSCKQEQESKAPAAPPAVEPPPAPTPPPPPPPPAPAPPVIVYYNVELTEIGPNKMTVIKTYKDMNKGMRLRAAIDAVESPPLILGENLATPDAEALKAKFEAVGAVITLKPL